MGQCDRCAGAPHGLRGGRARRRTRPLGAVKRTRALGVAWQLARVMDSTLRASGLGSAPPLSRQMPRMIGRPLHDGQYPDGAQQARAAPRRLRVSPMRRLWWSGRTSDVPRQFIAMGEKDRCSTFFCRGRCRRHPTFVAMEVVDAVRESLCRPWRPESRSHARARQRLCGSHLAKPWQTCQ
jgi:hypothetical protein